MFKMKRKPAKPKVPERKMTRKSIYVSDQPTLADFMAKANEIGISYDEATLFTDDKYGSVEMLVNIPESDKWYNTKLTLYHEKLKIYKNKLASYNKWQEKNKENIEKHLAEKQRKADVKERYEEDMKRLKEKMEKELKDGN